jgi:hypothetical protein
MNVEATCKVIDWAVQSGKVISVVTYTFRETSEKIVNYILRTILTKYNKEEWSDVLYTCVKEVILNAAKANIKRVVFKENNINPTNPDDYKKGISILREYTTEHKSLELLPKLKEYGYDVVTTFYYNEKVLNVKVKNRFVLYKFEEERIREKFSRAVKVRNLADYYMAYMGEHTSSEDDEFQEASGLGIILVNVLLKSIGINPRHAFVIFSNKYGETVAKLQIPFAKDFVPKREEYEQLIAAGKISPEDIRGENYSVDFEHF